MMETVKGFDFKTLIGSGKDLVALLRDLLLFLIALLLLVFPRTLNEVLQNAGFVEGSVAGFKWKNNLIASDSALKKSEVTIVSLQIQIDSMSSLLNEAQKKISDPEFKDKLSNIEKSGLQVAIAATKTQESLKKAITSNRPLVRMEQSAVNTSVQLGVVISGDASLKGATDEVKIIASRYGISGASIYLRENSYRTVFVTSDQGEAKQILSLAKKRRKDAYIVTMDSWCPDSESLTGYQRCFSK
jgi:hypothetical protein